MSTKVSFACTSKDLGAQLIIPQGCSSRCGHRHRQSCASAAYRQHGVLTSMLAKESSGLVALVRPEIRFRARVGTCESSRCGSHWKSIQKMAVVMVEQTACWCNRWYYICSSITVCLVKSQTVDWIKSQRSACERLARLKFRTSEPTWPRATVEAL